MTDKRKPRLTLPKKPAGLFSGASLMRASPHSVLAKAVQQRLAKEANDKVRTRQRQVLRRMRVSQFILATFMPQQAQMLQAMQAIAESRQQIAASLAALAAPRRLIPTSDQFGPLIEVAVH